jgi:hypothetical protein
MSTVIAVIGIDIGKNTFYVVGHDARDAIPCSPYGNPIGVAGASNGWSPNMVHVYIKLDR